MGTITFRKQSQAILFEHELKGQISDGHWENLNVRNHFYAWCDAKVVVGEPVGRDFPVRYDRYNFTDRDLLDTVEKRMLGQVRVAKHYGEEAISVLECLFDCEGFEGMPTHEGVYWDAKREIVTNFMTDRGITLAHIQAVVEADNIYGHLELMADLKEMKAAIKVKSNAEQPMLKTVLVDPKKYTYTVDADGYNLMVHTPSGDIQIELFSRDEDPGAVTIRSGNQLACSLTVIPVAANTIRVMNGN